MARRKSGAETPERSQLSRAPTVAFAKRQRTSGEELDDGDDATQGEAKSEAKGDAKKSDAAKADAKPDAKADAKPATSPDKPEGEGEAKQELPPIEPPPPKAEPWPDATPQPMKPVEPARARTETIGMPTDVAVGRPPEMPRTTAPPPLVLGEIENPTHMPGPRDIPAGNPDDPAPAPGRVPAGDSRSLRRFGDRAEFALIYRLATFVVTRSGVVGTRGQWRVVEYPTSSAASHAYAKECSRFVSDGFSDYRE